MKRTVCMIAMLTLLAQAVAAAALASITITVVDESGKVLQGASITLSTSAGTFSATTDESGRIAVNVPAGDYTVRVWLAGFGSVNLSVKATAGSARTATVTLRRSGEGSRPPPPPRPGDKSAEATVHDALVAGYNQAHPEHKAGGLYFGRYTYVLVRDNGDRSKSLIAALVQKFDSDGQIAVGPMTDINNPWGYNLFLLPLKDEPIAAGSLDAESVVKHYNFTVAKNLRDRYCSIEAHAQYSLCKPPYDDGPILLTFLLPLSDVKDGDPLPPALAYDFSDVPEAQFAVTIDKLQKTVAVADPIKSDTILPPPVLSRYVAPLLSEITAALTNLIPKLKMFHDSGILP